MKMPTRPRVHVRSKARIAWTTAAVLVVALLVSPAQSATADTAPPTVNGYTPPTTVSADALPTVQQNGVVWAQALAGNTVYATGDFSQTWPAGQSASDADLTPRANLLAYDITTGQLVTSFDHALNAQGRGIAVSPDGSTLYVVGNFTTVDGVPRDHIAAFDTSTGALVPSFHPSLNASADAVVATDSAVYVGGSFTAVNGVARSHLAALATGTGALTGWAPSADGQVLTLALSTDGSRVLVGGSFVHLDGAVVYGLGAVSPSTAKVQTFAVNHIIKNASSSGKCGITSLTVAAGVVYGTAFASGCGDFEGRFAADADTGKPIWINDCHGDSYDAVPIGPVLYSVGHAHDCSAVGSFPDNSKPYKYQRTLAETTAATGVDTGPDTYGWNYAGQPDATVLHWFPTLTPGTVTGQNQAAWSIVGNADYVALGGEFPSVNGVAQAGLVRFAVSSDAPNLVGPDPSPTLTPTASSTSAGVVNLSWTATWDKDNENLTYNVVRDGTTVATIHQSSAYWNLPTMTFTDTGLAVGSTHTYRITVSDPFGNTVTSMPSAQVTVSDSGAGPTGSGPQASFTTSCSQATCSVDGTGSSDPTGTIDSYTWDFGDSQQASGATVTHRYATSGQHTVTLTVQDGSGATNSISQPVTTSLPPQLPIALDAFGRTTTSGWGDADVGGQWVSGTGCGKLSVRQQSGYFVARRSQSCLISLQGVHSTTTDTTTSLETTGVPKGGIFLSVLGRCLNAYKQIRLQLHVLPNGKVTAQLIARQYSISQALSKAVTVAGLNAAHARLLVRLQVSGTNPTLVRAKVWAGRTQPGSWTVSGRTSLAALQHDGTVGYAAYLPAAKNATTATARVGALSVVRVAN